MCTNLALCVGLLKSSEDILDRKLDAKKFFFTRAVDGKVALS